MQARSPWLRLPASRTRRPECPAARIGSSGSADFDASGFAAIVGRSAQIRQVYEAVSFQPGVLGSIKNSFNGLQFGFGYSAEAISIVLAGHGPSAAYGYSDYRMAAISDRRVLEDRTTTAGRPVSSNLYLRRGARYDTAADPDDDARCIKILRSRCCSGVDSSC